MNLELIGEGKTAGVYRDGDRAIKLYRHTDIDAVRREAERQRFAAGAGLPVPAVFGVYPLEGGVALEMAYVSGTPLMWPRMEKTARRRAIERLAALQCRVQSAPAYPLDRQTERLAEKIRCAPQLEAPMISRLLERLDALDRGAEALCHGDFHVLNLIDDGEALWIIDWVDAVRGDPLADACRTYLIFRQHLSRLSDMYLRAYCKSAGVDSEAVLAWLPIVAAARLSERLDKKGEALMLNLVEGGLH